MPLLEFHAEAEFFDIIPHPYPATGAVPEWLKQMPMDRGGERTLKRCPPFLQAITAGYIIPVPWDVEFIHSPQGELRWNSGGMVISGHFESQYADAPFARLKLLKFHNPWVVKTPPGYSALFTPAFG